MNQRLPDNAADAASSPQQEAERLLQFLQESRRTLEHQLQLLEQTARGSRMQAGQSSEVLLHQIILAAQAELGVLETQAQAWVTFLASLSAGVPEAAALAALQARMVEIEAAQARLCRELGAGPSTGGLDPSRAGDPR